LLSSLPAFAQEKFSATVDQSTIRVGENLTLTLTFTGAASGLTPPALPTLDKLQVVGGPYTSTSFSIVNGRSASSAAYSYALRAVEAGSAKIGEARIKFKGKDYLSNAIAVTVLPAGSNVPDPSGKAGSAGADVFLRVYPDKTDALIGEQITLVYKLYFAVQMTNPEMTKMPTATGFWVEDYPMPAQMPVSDEVIGGRQYRVAVIRKSALFPTTTGDLTVEPLTISTKIEKARSRKKSRDPYDIFNDPFFQMGRQLEPVQVQCQSLKLHIKPLPPGNAPLGFAGAVGNYKITAELDRTACKTDDGITMTIRIEGTGNIKMLPKPSIIFPPDIQVYDPEEADQIRRDQAKISGVKTFKYVVIPRAPGIQVIPAIQYGFFDPDRDKYVAIATPEMRLQVEKGVGGGQSTSGITVAPKRGVESVGTDIAFAKTMPGQFVSATEQPHETVIFWIWSGLPWAAVAATVLAVRQRERSGQGRLGRRAALNRAQKQLLQAEKLLKAGNSEAIIRQISESMDSAIFFATGKPGDSLTSEELEELWRVEGLSPDLLQKITHVRIECDRTRFAAGSTSLDAERSLIKLAKDALENLNRSPAGKRVAA
jgi:hypothetical protein